ncbi:MAG TPA: tetratricopeptide repeat protein [Acidimicrobiales bacterium]|nr:tetratricopeptide repeat protein [Acidimicrobiales bacterium]
MTEASQSPPVDPRAVISLADGSDGPADLEGLLHDLRDFPARNLAGEESTFGTLIAEIRRMASTGDSEMAASVAAAVASDALEAGLPELAAVVVRIARDLVPDGTRAQAEIDNVLGMLALRLGQAGVALNALQRALGAVDTGDSELQTGVLLNLANAERILGDADSARSHVLSALAVASDTGDGRRRGQLLLTLASMDIDANAMARADEVLDEVQQIVTQDPRTQLESSLCGNRGLIARANGDLVAAEGLFRKSLDAARRARDVTHEAVALQDVAASLADQGRLGEAIRWYRRAVRFAERSRDYARCATLELSLGRTLHRAGRMAEASQHFERAVTLSGYVSPEERAEMVADLGASYVDAASPAAEDTLRGAFGLAQDLALPQLAQRTARNLAALFVQRGEYDRALSEIDTATQIGGDANSRAELMQWRFELVLDSGTLEEAETAANEAAEARSFEGSPAQAWSLALAGSQLLGVDGGGESAVRIFRRALSLATEDPHIEFHIRNDLAIALAHVGDFAAAREELLVNDRLSERLGDRAMAQQTLFNLGEVSRRSGDPSAGLVHLEGAVALARVLEDAKSLGEALNNLGQARVDLNDMGGAEAAYAEAIRVTGTGSEANDVTATALAGQANVRFARGDLTAALSLYLRAADLGSPASDLDYVLAALHCIAAGAPARAWRSLLQRVIDLAQGGKNELSASEGLGAVAVVWVSRIKLKRAAQCHAVALLLTGSVGRYDDTAELQSLLAGPLVLVARNCEAAESKRKGAGSMLGDLIVKEIDQHLGDERASVFGELIENARGIWREATTDD